MTSLSLLSCPNNALKIERKKRNVTERERERGEKKVPGRKKKEQEMDRLIKNPLNEHGS